MTLNSCKGELEKFEKFMLAENNYMQLILQK